MHTHLPGLTGCYPSISPILPSTFPFAKPKRSHSPTRLSSAASLLVKKILLTLWTQAWNVLLQNRNNSVFIFWSHSSQLATQNPGLRADNAGIQDNVCNGHYSWCSLLCNFWHFIYWPICGESHHMRECQTVYRGSVCTLTELNYSKEKLKLEGTTADHHLVQTLVQSKSNFEVGSCFSRICPAVF